MRLPYLLSFDGRVWSASLLNALFLGFQLVKILQTKSVESVSLIMFAGFLYMQITYLQLGIKTRQKGLIVGMLLSAIADSCIIFLTIYYRYGGIL